MRAISQAAAAEQIVDRDRFTPHHATTVRTESGAVAKGMFQALGAFAFNLCRFAAGGVMPVFGESGCPVFVRKSVWPWASYFQGQL